MKACKPILVAMLCAAIFVDLVACTPKMTTVRPKEISKLQVERLSDGAMVRLPEAPGDGELMEKLIFQLEEPYERMAACGEQDGHLYRVRLYIGAKLDTEVILNGDGSVCRGGSRYTPYQEAERPVNVSDWEALLQRESAPEKAASQNPAASLPGEAAEELRVSHQLNYITLKFE